MRNSDLLRRKSDASIGLGEVPYQANLHAFRALEIDDDPDAGIDEIGFMLRGIGPFARSFREIRNAARSIAKRVASLR